MIGVSDTGKQKREPGSEPLPVEGVGARGDGPPEEAGGGSGAGPPQAEGVGARGEGPPEEAGGGPGIGPLLAGGVLVAAAWILTGGVPWPERAMATLLLGVIPSMLMVGETPTALPEGVSRHWIYGTSGAGLWALAALAFFATLPSGDVGNRLGFAWPGTRYTIAWTVLLTLAGAAVVAAWRWAGHRESDVTRFLLPVTAGERLHFIWLSVTAGVTEEIVYRAFLIGAVATASGSAAVGVAVAALAFGVAHRYQGTVGAARAATLGAILSAPLLVLDSIVPAIFAHALLDLFAGLWWRERLWEETIVPPRSST